jgi:hypothetical protein
MDGHRPELQHDRVELGMNEHARMISGAC